MSKIIDSRKLLQEICNWYGYKLEFDGKEAIIKGHKIENGEVLATEERYESARRALKDWLDTLVETNANCKKRGIKQTWTDEEINYIKSLTV
jgi:hypothetical protein